MVDSLKGFFAGKHGDLLLESFNSRKEFENHEKDKDEARQNDSVDIVRNTNELGEGVGDTWEQYNNSHATPDDDTDRELEDGLASLMFEEFLEALEDHDSSDNSDDYLI